MKCRVIAVLGTRPEAIKLALVIHELRRRSEDFETAVVHTGQHRTMLDHVLQYFKIKPDFDPRLYGFKKLSDLVKSMRDDLEIEERKTAGTSAKSLYVRRRAAT